MAEHIPPGPWDDFPEAWDIVSIADRDWPGLASVDITATEKWDTKKAQGTHGGEREYKGADLSKIKISLVVWTSEQWDEIVSELLPLVRPVPGKKTPSAHKLRHVTAAAMNVTAITIDSITVPPPSGGRLVLSIDATEHREPDSKNAGGKAKGGKGTICEELAMSLRLLMDDRAVQANALNEHLLKGEIPLAVGADQRVRARDVEIQAIKAHMVANGCTEAGVADNKADKKAGALV